MQMDTPAVCAVTLRDFLERDLQLGKPVEVETLASIFDGAKKIGHYSKLRGMLRATLNTVDRNQWAKLHLLEEPSTVLYNVLTDPLTRVESFIKRELAKHGLIMQDKLAPHAVNVRAFSESVRRFVGYYAELNPQAPQLEVLSSFTLRRVPDQPNWDVVIRVALYDQNDSAYVEFCIPKVVEGVARLITVDQTELVVKSLSTFLSNFGSNGEIFKPLPYNDISRAAMHLVVHQPDISAEQVYRMYYDSVQANREAYNAAASQHQQLRFVIPWESMSQIQRQILSAAVEVARAEINAYLALNKALAAAEQ
ncbi:hypothetical protein [Ralstonia phage RP31]|uniref:Uncharacterized protein n=2 Tax=Ripduovirus RP12 TaxID=2560700 RepID=A0A1L7N0T3_9CAUD|nr:hypothetical protein FDH28_gp106 [Ralstonia phage RP12]BAW19080.1 hypothetical protein [Ralstonia phage RP12]BAW19365.1 hypothetical protein [Ralstonia phage RP31]